MMDVEKYLSRVYKNPPCFELVADLYAEEFGKGCIEYSVVNSSVRSAATAFRIALHTNEHGFRQVSEPVNGCLVLMSNRKHMPVHHCGVYYNGSILHALEGGNAFESVFNLKDSYPIMEWWMMEGIECL